MNEYKTIYQEFVPSNAGILSNLLPSFSAELSADAGKNAVGFYAVNDNISGITEISIDPVVPDARLIPSVSDSDINTTSMVAIPEAETSDTITLLEDINKNLTLIVFLILFIWAEKRIKNAVRSFTGRGLD